MKHRPIKAGNLFLRCSQGNARLLARQEADDGVEEQEGGGGGGEGVPSSSGLT